MTSEYNGVLVCGEGHTVSRWMPGAQKDERGLVPYIITSSLSDLDAITAEADAALARLTGAE